MGLHVVALAKLNLLFSSSTHTTTPLISGLICPFALKVTFSFRLVRRAYTDLLYSSRLFLFQLGHIAFDSDHLQPGAGNNSPRWERALRLVCERLTRARRLSTASPSDEDSFHAVSVLSL